MRTVRLVWWRTMILADIRMEKSSRRPDILIEKPDGLRYGINVGRTTAGGAPVKREVEALYDLEDADLPMYFVGYDK